MRFGPALFFLYSIAIICRLHISYALSIAPSCLKGAMMCGNNSPLLEKSSIYMFGGYIGSSTTDKAANNLVSRTMNRNMMISDAVNQDTWISRPDLAFFKEFQTLFKPYEKEYKARSGHNDNIAAWERITFVDPKRSIPLPRWKGTLTCFTDNSKEEKQNENGSLKSESIAILFGGSSPRADGSFEEDYYNDVWLLRLSNENPKQNDRIYEWKNITSFSKILPIPRRAHSAVMYDNRYVIIFGGKDKNDSTLKDTWVLDLNTYAFKELKQSGFPGGKRKGHSAVVYKTGMYVFGGRDGDVYYNDMFRLDLISWTWSEITYVEVSKENEIDSPTPRNHGVAEVLGDSMYFFSGRSSHASFKNYDELWKFHFDTKTWTQVFGDGKQNWPVGRIESSSATMMIKDTPAMIVFGGEDSTAHTRNDMWLFDSSNQKWFELHGNSCGNSIPVSVKIFSIIVLISFGALLFCSLRLRMGARHNYLPIP